MHKCVYILLWIYVSCNASAKEVCDFTLGYNFNTTLKCEESPSADDIIQAMEDLENKNVSWLTSLEMASCSITQFYVGTFDLHTSANLKGLRLDNNRLTSLPENLFNVTALRDLRNLNLGHNHLSYLSPRHFVYLKHLKNLDFSYNRFRKLRTAIFTSNPIIYLSLAGNYIEKLPDNFLAGNVSFTLNSFNLQGNKLREIPHFYLPKLKNLHLNNNNIRELPTGLFNSTHWSLLENIYLSSKLCLRIYSTVLQYHG